MRKPKIRESSCKWLNEIDAYLRQHDLHGENARHAAADVLDGWATRDELDDLIRKRLLQIVRYNDGELRGDRESCGSDWSVHLTERALRAFWPERMAA